MVQRWKRADRRRDAERGDRRRIKEMKMEQTLKTDGIEFGLVTPSHAYFWSSDPDRKASNRNSIWRLIPYLPSRARDASTTESRTRQ